MTILVQQQLRAAAQEVSPWSGSLTHTWKCQAEDYTWIVGHVDEDGVQYTVARVEADAYDYQGVSEKLAEFFRLANPAAVLALLDELDQLKAENADLRRLHRYWKQRAKSAEGHLFSSDFQAACRQLHSMTSFHGTPIEQLDVSQQAKIHSAVCGVLATVNHHRTARRPKDLDQAMTKEQQA